METGTVDEFAEVRQVLAEARGVLASQRRARLAVRSGRAENPSEPRGRRTMRRTGAGGVRRVTREGRGALAYRITTEGGELLAEFLPGDSPKGDMGALHRAARRAHALQQEGRTVLLRGPEGFLTRRYAPEYLESRAARRWPYRVPCSVPGCPNWRHPVSPGGSSCREHFEERYAGSETATRRVEEMNAARLRRRTPKG